MRFSDTRVLTSDASSSQWPSGLAKMNNPLSNMTCIKNYHPMLPSLTYHEKNMVFIGKPLENPLKVKTVVYLCAHAEKPQVKKTSQSAKKCVKTIKSIKIGCSASIYKHIMTDGTVCIKYNWQHPNHDPFKIEEISPSRLPDELKQ
ncbi:hypothetical protein F4703DRAFT_1937623 [Phycomyces blakesleeanus]